MRPSALGLSAHCPASFSLNKGFGSEIAVEGSAFHILAKNKVLNEPIDYDYVQKRYNFNEQQMKDLRIGIYNLEINIPECVGVIVHAEEKIKSTTMNLQGTPDLFLENVTFGSLIDWKNGRSDIASPKDNLQMIAYAVMLFEKYPNIETIDMAIMQTRLRQYKEHTITCEEAMKYREIIKEIITESEKENPQFVIGSWCGGDCFNSLSCPAFAGQYLDLANTIVPKGSCTLTNEDLKEMLTVLLPIAKRAVSVADGIIKLAKAYVDRNGSLNLGGGTMYTKVEEEKNKIDVAKALPVLKSFFQGEETEVITLSMSKITEFARKKERGLAKQISAKMEEVGALYKEPATVYRMIKGVVEIEDENESREE